MVPFDLLSILRSLRQVLPADAGTLALHEPEFQGNEWSYVKECLDTGMVSSIGRYVDEFEMRLTQLTGVEHAIATVNGTAALHCGLRLLGVDRDDEVLVPAMTFVATANAISYCGAMPHFIDCEERTFGVDPDKLAKYLAEVSVFDGHTCWNRLSGKRIRALIAVHTFGHPVDLDPLVEICRKFRIEFVEDAAQSLGSYYKGRHTGNWGRVAALSFNGNKIITTGGGGAILTNDKELAIRAKHLTTTAKIPHPWAFTHDQVGYNYRLPNINAAIGCAQLEQLPRLVERKRRLAERYQLAFRGLDGVRVFTEPPYTRSNYWLNTLVLDARYAGERDALLASTHEQKILTRPTWTLLHRLPMYQRAPRMALDVVESLEQRVVNLPSSACLAMAFGVSGATAVKLP